MEGVKGGDDRLLTTLQRLLEIPAADLRVALTQASDTVAAALKADKVDSFLYDASRDSLVALGASTQPLSAQQRKLGLDVLPITNGGRAVEVFRTGSTYVSGSVDHDPEELRGIREALRVRSTIAVPLEITGTRRGVLMVTSLQPEFFTADDVRFAELISRWVALVGHRAELVEEISKNALEHGRRVIAEELVTVLAHDLRNYISPIDVRLKRLQRRAEREQRPRDVHDAEHALRVLARLAALISDMLDAARIDRGVFQMNAQPVELMALLQEIAGTLSTPEQDVRVAATEELFVIGDPARLRQCIENLLSNALRYSPEGMPVTIVLSRARSKAAADVARIDVIDEGPGVPTDLLPRLFDRFVTGQHRPGGLGLGLYLAKRIAVMHRGDLTVESIPGKGSRFTLCVPCYPELDSDAPPDSSD